MAIIQRIWQKGKMWVSGLPESVLIALIVILASSGSFGMGILVGKESQKDEIQIQQLPLEAMATPEVQGVSIETPALPAGGQYVASKKGSKYHLPWCPGAKTMKEENKIWFDSKEAAEAAGYTPAGNCKGI